MKHTKHLLVLWAALLLGAGNAWGADMCIDFESATTAYSDWTFTNMTSQQTGTITAKGGTYYGTTGGKATASITTKTAIATPTSITFYVSKQSSNTKSSSWKVQVSSDNSTWNDVKTQSATSMSQGTWVEVTQDLSSYSNVYVRVYYTGSTAVRNIDNLCLTSGSTGTTPLVEPTNLSVSNVTSTTVNLSWDAVTNATGYIVPFTSFEDKRGEWNDNNTRRSVGKHYISLDGNGG